MFECFASSSKEGSSYFDGWFFNIVEECGLQLLQSDQCSTSQVEGVHHSWWGSGHNCITATPHAVHHANPCVTCDYGLYG